MQRRGMAIVVGLVVGVLVSREATAQLCATCSAASYYQDQGCAESVPYMCCSSETPCGDGYRPIFCEGPAPPGCTDVGFSCGPFASISCCPGEPEPCDVCAEEQGGEQAEELPVSGGGCAVGRVAPTETLALVMLAIAAVASRRRRNR